MPFHAPISIQLCLEWRCVRKHVSVYCEHRFLNQGFMMGYTRVHVLLVLFFYISCMQLALISSHREPSILKHGGERDNIGGERRRNKCVQLVGETEGPYWKEENIEASNLKANLSDVVPLNLTFRVVDGELSLKNGVCEPISMARIDLWHARYDGCYSDVSKDHTEGETWLRGYQYTNSTGYALFNTIFPGWYRSRTVHIHVRVRLYNADNYTLYEDTTQMFFDDAISTSIFENVYPYNERSSARDTYNSNDSLFADSNVVPLVGNYLDKGGYNGIVEFTLPLSWKRSEVEEESTLTV
eukprot:c21616_g1_i1 orf=118-1011(+)